MLRAAILLSISLLPVALLMLFIYLQDKYEKEPIGMLALAFFGGCASILVTLFIVFITNSVWQPHESYETFYSAFIEAGIPEECSKFGFLFLLFWWNKNFNEHMDGIVYATFVSLGFACIENILYVFGSGFGTGIMRAVISVPGHFLFAVLMGYFFSLAKFSKNGAIGYLLLCVLIPACVHGLFDWMLMITEKVSTGVALLIMMFFIGGDVLLWIVGVRSIKKHVEKSPFKPNSFNSPNRFNK